MRTDIRFRAIAAAASFHAAMGELAQAPGAVCHPLDRVRVVEGVAPPAGATHVVGFPVDDDAPRPTSRRYA